MLMWPLRLVFWCVDQITIADDDKRNFRHHLGLGALLGVVLTVVVALIR